MDRRDSDDRRSGEERRHDEITVASERRTGERRSVRRRRHIDPTTCERDYTSEEIRFMHALDAYKRASGRMFPTCSEILEVIRELGYRRLEDEADPQDDVNTPGVLSQEAAEMASQTNGQPEGTQVDLGKHAVPDAHVPEAQTVLEAPSDPAAPANSAALAGCETLADPAAQTDLVENRLAEPILAAAAACDEMVEIM